MLLMGIELHSAPERLDLVDQPERVGRVAAAPSSLLALVEREVQQPWEACLDLGAPQPVCSPSALVALLDEAGVSQDREVMAEPGLADGHVE
jgi:hypothetical protein